MRINKEHTAGHTKNNDKIKLIPNTHREFDVILTVHRR